MPIHTEPAEIQYFGKVPSFFPENISSLPIALLNATVERQGNTFYDKLAKTVLQLTLLDQPAKSGEEKFVKDFLRTYQTFIADVKDSVKPRKSRFEEHERRCSTASMSQRLAREFLALENSNGSKEYVQSATILREILYAFHEQDVAFGTDALNLYHSALAQAAVMNVLKKDGYIVYAPDPENMEEVTSWDVNGGVDFVAIHKEEKGCTIHLIDVKGRVNECIGRVNLKNPLEEQEGRIGKIIQSIRDDFVRRSESTNLLDSAKIVSEIVVVPTDPHILGVKGIFFGSNDVPGMILQGLQGDRQKMET
jgi:hypothetical protein